jgi:hypothetical protein
VHDVDTQHIINGICKGLESVLGTLQLISVALNSKNAIQRHDEQELMECYAELDALKSTNADLSQKLESALCAGNALNHVDNTVKVSLALLSRPRSRRATHAPRIF